MSESIHVEINKSVFLHIVNYFNLYDDNTYRRQNIIVEDPGPTIKTTISKLRILSKLIEIPVSTFFLSTQPELGKRPKDFRGRSTQIFSRKIINSIRRAEWFRELIQEFIILTKFNLPVGISQKDDPALIGEQIRSLVQYERWSKKSYKPGDLFRKLKTVLEDYNIFVFQQQFNRNESRGFSLAYTAPFVIVVNQSENYKARIFTMFHELGHILLGKPGISEPIKIDRTKVIPVEKWCDEFASAVTLSRTTISGIQVNLETPFEDIRLIVGEKAKSLHISKHNLIYNLYKNSKIALETYQRYIKLPYLKKAKQEKPKIKYFRKIISANGKKFTDAIIDAYNVELISNYDVKSILKIKQETLDDLLFNV